MRKRLSCYVVTLCVVACFFQSHAGQASSQLSSQKAITNDDIISMTKAGISETAIATLIENSPHEFDLSPQALVALKNASVPNSVIEAMLRSTRQAPASVSAKSPDLPASYGYYLSDAGRYVQIQPAQVTSKIGISVLAKPGPGVAVDGFAGNPTSRTTDASPTLIVYQQNADVTNVHLAQLVYVDSMRAYEFNLSNTAPQFFESVYGRGYNDNIPIALWRASGDIPLRIEPVDQRQGMYRITPASPLSAGRYALYFKDAMHKEDIIFATQPGRRTEAPYYEITTPTTMSRTLPSGVATTGPDSQPGYTGPTNFPVVHTHRFGMCSGTLFVSNAGIRYQQLSGDGKDSFDLPMNQLESARTVTNQLEIKLKNGRSYRFAHGTPKPNQALVILGALEQAVDEQPIEPIIDAIARAAKAITRDQPAASSPKPPSSTDRQLIETLNAALADDVISEYVSRVGQNIVRNSDAKFPITIKVSTSEAVSIVAYPTYPNGQLFISQNLMRYVENESELAAILAHFLVHASSDRSEPDADTTALKWLHSTGYDVNSYVSAMSRSVRISEQRAPSASAPLSSHLLTPERSALVAKTIAELPARDQSVVDTSELSGVKARIPIRELPVFSAIEQVDLKNFACSVRASSKGKNFAIFRDRKGGLLVMGEVGPDGKLGESRCSAGEVVYGDLTGDGSNEAAIVLGISAGATGDATEGFIFTLRNGQPVLLAEFGSGWDQEKTVMTGRVAIQNGLVVVKGDLWGPDDPNCCGSYVFTTQYRWNGSRLVQEERTQAKKAQLPPTPARPQD